MINSPYLSYLVTVDLPEQARKTRRRWENAARSRVG